MGFSLEAEGMEEAIRRVRALGQERRATGVMLPKGEMFEQISANKARHSIMAFIDGGNCEIFLTPSLSLHFVRVASVI